MENGKVLMSFSGKELIKGESSRMLLLSRQEVLEQHLKPEAIPHGIVITGIRETGCRCNPCIPTAFCSYTGEALDQKTPLLRLWKQSMSSHFAY